MWKVSWFYEKVHNIANFGGYAAILLSMVNLLKSEFVKFFLRQNFLAYGRYTL